MIGQIAAATTHLRVGSGGVMLPNHAPLMVAERFKVLEALFPGRIDLGLGRAPGTDPATSYALRRRQGISEEDDFLDRFNELMLLETRGFPAGHPFHNVRAMPADVALPPIYLLGSSDYSAQLAGQIGAAFAFAHHFATFDAVEAMRLYRDNFRPSPSHEKPYAILGDARGLRRHRRGGRAAGEDRRSQYRAPRQGRISAPRLAGRRRGLRLLAGRPRAHRAEPHQAVGRRAGDGEGQARAADRRDQADELMVTTMIFSHEARKHSYELLAKAFADLSPGPARVSPHHAARHARNRPARTDVFRILRAFKKQGGFLG